MRPIRAAIRPGGFNSRPLGPASAQLRRTSVELEFEPETVDAFELGAKYNGRVFDVNVAVFHQTFDKFQLNTFNGINFLVENIKACSGELTTPTGRQSLCPRAVRGAKMCARA